VLRFRKNKKRLILEKFVVASSSLFDMACLITIATTFSDCH